MLAWLALIIYELNKNEEKRHANEVSMAISEFL
jgi:hypothetical protein